ncbi:2-keto-4-pentenoate hydratase [Rhodovibrionaceae bacterium A322]
MECEIAVILGRDLPDDDRVWQPETLAPYIDAACASIELVDDRFDDYSHYGVRAMVADDFFNSGIVLGAPVSFDSKLDLPSLIGSVQINGQQAGQGSGREILGHPLTALSWLASHLQTRGKSLKAGEFVTLGSVVKTQWIDQPDTLVEIQFSQLGGARVQFC